MEGVEGGFGGARAHGMSPATTSDITPTAERYLRPRSSPSVCACSRSFSVVSTWSTPATTAIRKIASAVVAEVRRKGPTYEHCEVV